VIIEIFVLALASTIRPTSLAAVYALLAHDSRRALMTAYVLGGLAFTVVFGLLVVYAFQGIHIAAGTGRTKAIANIIAGLLALGFGVAVLTGRVRRSPDGDAPSGTSGRLRTTLQQRMSVRTAVVAGPATHIPGIFYIIALNVIVAHEPRVARGTLAVMNYNAIWFALPIAALVTCIVNPDAARAAIASVQLWTVQHSRGIMLVVAFTVGTALVIRGALNL
jgi:Sap, sulfolipid-1-addressing protein